MKYQNFNMSTIFNKYHNREQRRQGKYSSG